MNIKITHNWLMEYLDTDATPQELQKYLSLCGPSFERIDKAEGSATGGMTDYIYDIEVTSNRVDMASVFGIAQEAQSILPQFGKAAKLRFNPLEKYTFASLNLTETGKKPLHITVTDPSLASRFTALVFTNIKNQPAPDVIRQRLEMCDIKSINNIVDISNYLMLSLGQPTHMFDYDKIGKASMILRESKKGEKLITLDSKEIALPGGDIVMEDGNGKLIDLCGIMGGENSEITQDTNTVVLFVQTYDKRRIRKTSMTTGQRTVAATYFEKGLDPERVEPTLVYGTHLLKDLAHGQVASPIYDIYPHPYQPKKVTTDLNSIQNIIGVAINEKHIERILTNLGFDIEINGAKITVTVPSFRAQDIDIKEDIVEEVARVYGYHNIPNALAIATHIKQHKETELLFTLQNKVKYFLKHLGLHESMNYSMISEELIEKLELSKKDHIMLSNTISEEIKYMRTALIPSLIKNIKENEGKKEHLKFFEIAKTYHRNPGDLPTELYNLGIAMNTDFFDLKGVIEALFKELNIEDYSFGSYDDDHLAPHVQAEIKIHNKAIGVIGQLKNNLKENMDIRDSVYVAQLDFSAIISSYRSLSTYRPLNAFATIKLDLSVEMKNDLTFAKVKQEATNTSELLQKIEYIDSFKDNMTIRLYFSANDRNITHGEAQKELEKIKLTLTK